MMRWSSLIVVGLVLLAAGGIAGQRLGGFHERLAATASDAPPELTESRTVLNDAEPPVTESAAFSDFTTRLATHTTTDSSADTAPTDSAVAADPAIRDLILQMNPDVDPETASIWAESLSGLPLDEAAFLLEQRSLSVPTAGNSFLSSASRDVESIQSAASGFQPDGKGLSLDAAIEQVRSNLSNAWSPGHRRVVVLPEAVASGSSGRTFRASRTVSLSPGRMISSANPLHVALPAEDERLMFLLEDGQLTRRGDFAVLSDSRIGLRTASGELAIEGSPVLDAPAGTDIMPNGDILSAGTVIGRLAIVRVSSQAVVTITNGACLRASDTPERVTSDVVLHVGSLELSNVDVPEERQLLDMLTSLRP